MKKQIVLIVVFLMVLLASCSKDDKTAGGVTEDQGLAIIDKNVAGVSQKGPFVIGSSVKLYELDSDYSQTGRSFNGKIESDLGEFSLKNIQLKSRYAWFESNGYYRNEITGKTSTGTITLYAITDLNQREKVNLNVLTHLEFDRIMNLLEKKVDFVKAKKQAEGEILSIFGLQLDDSNFEDLSIFESGDDDAKLLAVSILLQGNKSEGELTELLTKISNAVSAFGVLNDDSTKTEIADWAESANLTAIRANVERWNSNGSVPQFEKYVKQFWWDNYGLGLCTVDNELLDKVVENKLSVNYGATYRCVNGNWLKHYNGLDDLGLSIDKYNELMVGMNGVGFDAWSYPANKDVGYWVFGSDATMNANGHSYTVFGKDSAHPVATILPVSSWREIPETVLEACDGICGTSVFVTDDGSDGWQDFQYSPSQVWNKRESINASSWLGLCFQYEFESEDVTGMFIALFPLNVENNGGNDYSYHLEKTEGALKTVNIPWVAFDKAKDAPATIEETVESLWKIKLVTWGHAGAELYLHIKKLGAYGTCD